MSQLASALFRQDHPSPDRTLLLLMRFGHNPWRATVHRLIRDTATTLGFDVVRADDRDYSGELWTNVKLCLDNTALAIAVFDGVEHNLAADTANLAVELGYLFARDTPCLILRERSLPQPPAMLAHRLHTPFDALDLDGTLQPPVQHWLTAHAARVVA
ncbi:MAG TPA: hypothetical protein VFJ97_13405 [Dermatophilaceae bacterium]|nr:hypothetical protein [Dermatophilaceae bacterium]